MDKRMALLLSVCAIEVLIRPLYGLSGLAPLGFTLLARLVEGAVILVWGRAVCGVKTARFWREIGLGLGVAAAFGILVLAADLMSRLWLPDGLIRPLLGGPPLEQPLLYFLTGCVVAPFVEELFFRGLFYPLLRERLNVAFSIVISAVFFASLHGLFVPVQLIGGLMFAGLYEWRGNIWPAYVLHAAANTGIWVLPLMLR
jgi:membrane protease YdiL (CAAX protease family)